MIFKYIEKIEKIEKINFSDYLYDIEVENTNNFFADDILVHNCKHDGMRANAVVVDGKITFFARSGKILDLLGNLEEEFLEMSNDNNVVYDGELEVRDYSGNLLPRKQANGICSKALKGTISEVEASMICFALWDRIPYDAWLAGKDETNLFDRYNFLENDLSTLRYNSNIQKISLVGWEEAENFEKANEIFQRYLANGDEGIILKDIDSPWEDTRSKRHIKLKAERDADMLCTGVLDGTKKYTGMIGALQLTTSDGLIECNCGTGLSDEDRKKDPSEYIGKVIKIFFNEKIKSKGAKKMSLFLPVFDEIRTDKSVANSSTEI